LAWGSASRWDRSWRRAPAAVTIGVALVVLPIAIALSLSIPWRVIVEDLVVFPGSVYPRVRALPFPAGPFTLFWGGGLVRVWWLPPIIKVLGWTAVLLWGSGLLAVSRAGWRELGRPPAVGRLLLLVLTALLVQQARVRTDYLHLIPSMVALGLAIPAIVASGRHARPLRIVLGGSGVLLVLATGAMIPLRRIRLQPLKGCPTQTRSPEVAHRLGLACPVPAQAWAAEYLLSAGDSAAPIFVGAARHDRLVASDDMLYFLAGRPSVTGWYDLHPGLTTTLPVQQAIVADIEGARVQTVVRYADSYSHPEPNASSISSGVTLLDDYLAEHYRPVEQVGPYSIWTRAMPPAEGATDGDR